MMRVIRSELLRHKNPYFILGGIGLMAALSLMATTIMFVTAGESGMSFREQAVTVAMLEAADGMFVGVRNVTMPGIVVLAIWPSR